MKCGAAPSEGAGKRSAARAACAPRFTGLTRRLESWTLGEYLQVLFCT